MTPSDTHTDQREEAAEAQAPADTAATDAPVEAAAETPAPDAPAETPADAATDTAAEAPAETATEPAAQAEAPAEPAAQAEAPADTPTEPTAEPAAPADGAATTPARPREAKPPRRSRQADRRKQLEEQSRATAAALGREPDRKVIEKAILAAGGPDAVRDFMATPQESREGKPLGWRIACLREARRHDSGGKTEEGWVTLSAVPVRQIRGALDRAVVEDGRISFRDEAPARGRGGPRRGGDRRPGGRDERAVADQFMEGGVASFGGESSGKRNPFSALSGLLEDDEKE